MKSGDSLSNLLFSCYAPQVNQRRTLLVDLQCLGLCWTLKFCKSTKAPLNQQKPHKNSTKAPVRFRVKQKPHKKSTKAPPQNQQKPHLGLVRGWKFLSPDFGVGAVSGEHLLWCAQNLEIWIPCTKTIPSLEVRPPTPMGQKAINTFVPVGPRVPKMP